MTRRRLLVLASLAALLLFFTLRRRPAETVTAPEVAGDQAPRAAAGAGRWSYVPAMPAAAERPPAATPIIDEISVEKSHVCAGEENLVTVRAHTPDGLDDSFLRVSVGSSVGFQVPVVVNPSPERSERPRVYVAGRDGTLVDAPLPDYKVDDCKVPRRVIMRMRIMPNTEDEVELYAQVLGVGTREPFVAKSWRWTFGDGTTTTTSTPIATHDYGRRPQDALESHFLVTATAVGENGETVTGRHPVALLNNAFENLATKGVVLIRTALTPRFAELDADGMVRQRVAVWHHHQQAVRVTRVVRTRYVDNNHALPDEPVPAESVLGAAALSAGSKLEIAATLDTRRDPRVVYETYAIEGISGDGRPAFGQFSIMVPPRHPDSPDKMDDAVVDRVLAAKIVRAQKMLGRRFVTDEDLFRLEREGAFAGLAPLSDLKIASRQATP
jgi:hypothetical protein